MERTKYTNKKKCKKCGIFKPLSDYCKLKASKDGLHIYCKECRRKEQKMYWRSYWDRNKTRILTNKKIERTLDPDKHRAYRRMLYLKDPYKNRDHWYKTKYNIRLYEYIEMYNKQEGKCCICKTFYKKLSIDHDHKTNKVRGLLCRKCNIGLGNFKDNIISLQNAINYLQNGK